MKDDILLLKTIREERGKTQKDLACSIGVSIQTYANWENKKKPIPENRLDLVSKITGIDKNQLRSIFGRKIEEKPECKPGKNGSSRMFAKRIIEMLPCPNNGAKFSSKESMMKVCNKYQKERSKCKSCPVFKDENWMPKGVVIDESILNNK